MTVFLRRILRLCRLAIHTAWGLAQAALVFGFYSPSTRDRIISRWAAKLLRVLNIRLAAGAPPEFTHGALLVANHVSWLDVFIILATRRVHFVSKHEIRAWPVVGWVAERAGTLFIERARKADTARINREMHELLHDGAWVAVFPEGTSTDGRRLLRFLPSLFQPAVDESLPVVPVALQYRTPQGEYTNAAAYADNISLGSSLWRILGEKAIVARLTFGMPIRGSNRRELAETAYHEIATSLGFAPAGNPPGTPGDPPASAP
jgi:1-acyl-sn-glycerol-3-phosphate acyltransferase